MTFDKVKEVIMETLDCEAAVITMEASLTDDIGADSLDAAELSMNLEEAFDITIPDEALADFVTVKDIVTYIDEQKN